MFGYACKEASCANDWGRQPSSSSAAEETMITTTQEYDPIPLWKKESESQPPTEKANAAFESFQQKVAEDAKALQAEAAEAAQKAAEIPLVEDPGTPQKKTSAPKKKAVKAPSKHAKEKAEKAESIATESTPAAAQEEAEKPSAHIKSDVDVSSLTPEQKTAECKFYCEKVNASGALMYEMIDEQLVPVAHFVTEASLEKFAKACYGYKFFVGRGTIGRTYHSKLPEFLPDARKANGILMIRKKIAVEHGVISLHCVAYGNSVFEVFSKKAWSSPPEL